MVARIIHDDIEVWESIRSPRKYIEFHEDIKDFMYVLIEKKLICYLPLKDTPKIKPPSYQAHLFCNFYRRAWHATKTCFHLKNLIKDCIYEGKFKFDHEFLGDVLQQHREKAVQYGPVHPQNQRLKIFKNPFPQFKKVELKDDGKKLQTNVKFS